MVRRPESLIDRDAYPTLTGTLHATVADLQYGWKTSYLPQLRRLAKRWGKRVILTEIGYRSVRGSAQNPRDWWQCAPGTPTLRIRGFSRDSGIA